GWDSAPVRLRRILAALRSLRSLRVEPTFAIFFEDRRGFDRAPFYYGGGGIQLRCASGASSLLSVRCALSESNPRSRSSSKIAVGSTGRLSTTEGVGFSSGAPPAHPRCSPFAALSPSRTHVRDLLRRSPWVRQGAFLLRRGWDSAPVRLRRILAALRSLRSLRVEPTFAIFFEDRRG